VAADFTIEIDANAVEQVVAAALVVWMESDLGPRLVAQAIVEAPVGETGALANSMDFTIASGTSLVLWCRSDHALFVHEGTKPHPIEAVNAKVLRFPTEAGILYRRRVQHPGTSPNPFLMRAATTVLEGYQHV
jgi:hypothetical protein